MEGKKRHSNPSFYSVRTLLRETRALTFDVTSTIGLSYYCEASDGSGRPFRAGNVKRQFPGGSPQPAQNGTVTAEAATLAQTILDGASRFARPPSLPFNESVANLSDFYRLYLVPGAGHCGPNGAQANGPWPNTKLAVMIDWVENGIAPDTLNSTVLQGEHAGESQQLCAWPLRPFWRDDAAMVCEYDQASIDSWIYKFDAFKRPIY